MGIQNIIKNSQEETPSSDPFPENGPFFDDGELPLVIDIYSDTSDTESYSELHDAYDLLNIISYSGSENYDSENDSPSPLPPSPVFPLDMEQKTNEPRSILDTDICKQKVDPNDSKRIRRMRNITDKSRRSGMGKKKARRFENARQLSLLVTEDNDEYDDNDFMPFDCPFRFSQILEDADLANKILNPSLDTVDEFLNNNLMETHLEEKKTESAKKRRLTPSEAFDNLDQAQKTFFRRRNLPMGMVEYLDMCVFSFFENNPTGTFISEPLTSFERMMLHSIAHYYELNSQSFVVDDRIKRLTKVTNNLDYFDPPYLCLSQYLEEHLFKNSNSSPDSKRRRCKRIQRK